MNNHLIDLTKIHSINRNADRAFTSILASRHEEELEKKYCDELHEAYKALDVAIALAIFHQQQAHERLWEIKVELEIQHTLTTNNIVTQ